VAGELFRHDADHAVARFGGKNRLNRPREMPVYHLPSPSEGAPRLRLGWRLGASFHRGPGEIVLRAQPRARVVVVEQVAAARWNDTGLLNARGELFLRNARYVPPELPLLEGPDGSEGVVAQLYLDAQGRLLEAGVRLTGVRLDERGAWQLELANGVKVRLGRLAVTDRLDRFIRLASTLVAKRGMEIGYVDMRYTNGFSVGWNSRSALAVVPQEDATPDG